MDTHKKLMELIEDIGFTMMTTARPDGTLHSRPMACLKTEFDGELWFFTGKSSGKAKAISEEHHVNLAYSEPSNNRFVSVAGRAALIQDAEKAKELWNPIYRAWFPKGLEDPELCLLKVTVDSAEYWDSKSSKLVQLIGFAKAVMTGEPYKAGPNEHARVNLS